MGSTILRREMLKYFGLWGATILWIVPGSSPSLPGYPERPPALPNLPNSHDTWYNDDEMMIKDDQWNKKKYYSTSNRLECWQLCTVVKGWLQLLKVLRMSLNERTQAHDQQTPSPNHLTTRMEWGLVINQVDDHRAEICEHYQFSFPICMYTSQPWGNLGILEPPG